MAQFTFGDKIYEALTSLMEDKRVAGERQKDRDFTAEQGRMEDKRVAGERQKDRDFTAEQGRLDREWRTSERGNSQTFQTGERVGGETHQTNIQTAQNTFTGGQGDLNRALSWKEFEATMAQRKIEHTDSNTNAIRALKNSETQITNQNTQFNKGYGLNKAYLNIAQDENKIKNERATYELAIPRARTSFMETMMSNMDPKLTMGQNFQSAVNQNRNLIPALFATEGGQQSMQNMASQFRPEYVPDPNFASKYAQFAKFSGGYLPFGEGVDYFFGNTDVREGIQKMDKPWGTGGFIKYLMSPDRYKKTNFYDK